MTDIAYTDIYNLTSTIPWQQSLENDSTDPIYNQFLTFTDKESYLAWRTDWKDSYRALSERIRKMRQMWRAEGQNHDEALTRNLFRSRALARAMLELRKASKRKAQALYEASKETSQVA